MGRSDAYALWSSGGLVTNYKSDFNNGFLNKVGALALDAPTRSGGKKILTWEFTARGSQSSVSVAISVEKHEGGLRFKAACDKLVGEYADSDINALHNKVEAALLGQAAALSGIQWEDWLEVVVRGDNSDFEDSQWSALGASLHIQVNRLKRGMHPSSGEAVTINTNGVVVAFPKATSINAPEVDQGGLRLRGRPEERSYIPATAENRIALDQILERMALLRASMAGLLSQDTVADKLACVAKLVPALLE